MPFSDVVATREQVIESQLRLRAYYRMREQAIAIEDASVSEEHIFEAESGTVWRYVVLNDSGIRIEGCQPAVAKLYIPSSIEGKDVLVIANDACSNLDGVEELYCADTILSIGNCAFRNSTALKKVVFPQLLDRFDSDWLRGCRAVKYIVLPGMAQSIKASLFDLPALGHLVFGPGYSSVEPGTFLKSSLKSIEVSEENPAIVTDGKALYTRDWSTLLSLAVPCESYRIVDSCRIVSRKGMSNFYKLETIGVPDSLELIEDFAFSRTGITHFESSPSLRRIGEKAFFNCDRLETIKLSEGLVEIGNNAFSGTRLRSLRIPSSVDQLGNPLTEGTKLTYSGPDATFSIAEGAGKLWLDENGALYRRCEDGMHLIHLMDPHLKALKVAEGTVRIDERACAKHSNLQEAVLPEGLSCIGKRAFYDCRKFVRVRLPETLSCIEEEAFLDTALEWIAIPVALREIGSNALLTYGAHHNRIGTSLNDVVVDEGNSNFFTKPGLLLERIEGGGVRVLLCTDSIENVVIPAEVTEIAPYAFNGARHIKELYLTNKIKRVGLRGLALNCWVRHIHIDVDPPIEGHACFDIDFPDIDRSVQQIELAFSLPEYVNIAALFEGYDNTIISGCNYDAKLRGGISLYEQATRIMARLQDPVFLLPVNQRLCDSFLKNNIDDICVSIAKHDDRHAFDVLFDLGYLNEDNLANVIDRVGAVQDASITGYLLEQKRLRFRRSTMDFDL